MEEGERERAQDEKKSASRFVMPARTTPALSHRRHCVDGRCLCVCVCVCVCVRILSSIHTSKEKNSRFLVQVFAVLATTTTIVAKFSIYTHTHRDRSPTKNNHKENKKKKAANGKNKMALRTQPPPLYRGTFIPGVQTAESARGSTAQGPWSSVGQYESSLGNRQIFTSPLSASLLNGSAMMAQFGAMAPLPKRARTIEAAARGPAARERFMPTMDVGRANRIGRNITASYLADKVMEGIAGNPLQAVSNPLMRANDMINQNRRVRVHKSDPEFGQHMMGQVAWSDMSKYKRAEELDEIGGLFRTIPSDGYEGEELYAAGETQVPDGVYALYNTPVLNYVLRDLDKLNPRTAKPIWTPEKVVQNFRMDGVVASATDESHDPIYGEAGNVREYAVTINMRNPNTLNYWGSVAPSRNLWFLVKRIAPEEAPKRYVLSANLMTPKIFNVSHFEQDNLRPLNPIQVVPWIGHNGRDWPGADELLYKDDPRDDTTERMGVALRLGYTRKSATQANKEDVDMAWYDATAHRSLGPVDTIVSRKRSDGF
jgi:hypothetical protein